MKTIASKNQNVSTPSDAFTNLAPHYDELMDVVPYAAWVEYVQLLFEVAEVRPQTVLDCACGTGNVSFELAARGYAVTGVDLSPEMIEAAQQKLAVQSTSLPLQFFEADLTIFDLGEQFDAATCLYDSFNYILDPPLLEAAFARIAGHLKPGGIMVFDMNTPWAFEADLFTQRSRNSRRSLNYDWRADFDSDTRICDVTMNFERKTAIGVEHFSEVHRERAYSAAEVTAMLVQTGWKVLKMYDAYTLNPPHHRSERWYFVAQRF